MKEYTQWRLDFLTNVLAGIPEELKDRLNGEQKAKYHNRGTLLKETPEGWIKSILDSCLWYSHLFPGLRQCVDEDQREKWGKLKTTLFGLYNRFEGNKPYQEILGVGIRALENNRWANEYLRPDQITCVDSTRKNLSSLGIDYATIYEETKEDYNQPHAFNFFLNSEVWNQERSGGLKGNTNVNLMDACTGSGKTRMGLVASCGHLCYSNEVIPFAAQRVAVFVRTRSQTMAFLKESKRMDLKVACPISISLGCQCHDSVNKTFLDTIFALFGALRDSCQGGMNLSKKELKLPKIYPMELYNSVAISQETCIGLSNAVTAFHDYLQDSPDVISLLNRWSRDNRNRCQEACFLDLKSYVTASDLDAEKVDAFTYLMSSRKCASCPSNMNFLLKSGINPYEEARQFEQVPNKFFFDEALDKNADINKVALLYQNTFGCCGRTDSKKNMESADVVIFTYNWLMDPDIAIHTAKSLHNLGSLNWQISTICDEAHFLYGFNQRFDFNFPMTIKIAAEIWHAKLHYLDQNRFDVPGVGVTSGPNWGELPQEFKRMDLALKTLNSFLEKLFLMDEQIPTPLRVFRLATGHDFPWYPKQLYNQFNPMFDLDILSNRNQIETVYNTLGVMIEEWNRIIGVCEAQYTSCDETMDALMDSKEDDGDSEDEDGEVGNPWAAQLFKEWKASGSQSKGKFKRAFHKVIDAYKTLSNTALFLLEWTLILKETVYSMSSGTFDERILSVSIGSAQFDTIIGKNVLEDTMKPQDPIDRAKVEKLMLPYCTTIQSVGYAETDKSAWHKATPTDFFHFFDSPYAWMRNAKCKPAFQSLAATFKVNKPFIQTALRPYPYITFLTGTPADKTLWRSKSGFRYFANSDYPIKPNSFDFKIDSRFELKQANKSDIQDRDVAMAIQHYTAGSSMSLVCYPSKATMNRIMKFMGKGYLDEVLMEKEGVEMEDLQNYAATEGSIHVVCGGRFVEGIECTDENGSSLIKQVIIVGVPFNPPSEENRQIEAHFQKIYGWDQWECMKMLMYAPVYQKVRQAMGRCVRNLTDRGTIIFLDKRYETSKMLRQALGCF
jgi:hypothetical protein